MINSSLNPIDNFYRNTMETKQLDDTYDLDIEILIHQKYTKENTSGGPCGSGGCQMPQSQQCGTVVGCSQHCTQTCANVCS